MILSENMKSLRLADEDAGSCYVVVGCRGPLEAPKWVKDPEMDPKGSPQLPLIDLSPFPGSLTHFGASRRLLGQKQGPF